MEQYETCYVCGGEVDEDNDLCPGCDEYICQDCDGAFPSGEHDPDIHALTARANAEGDFDDDPP